MFQELRHSAALMAKQFLFGRHGEPYQVGDTTLRFEPGTRPINPKYRTSANSVSRYDALQVDLLTQNLGAGDFAIDIGAHAGQIALIMAARCGQAGRVIAFEPDAHARARLVRNLDLNKTVKRPQIEALALSDHSGEAILFSRGGDCNSSLSMSGLPSMEVEDLEQMAVTLSTLDDYLRLNNLPVPKLVKIDTEGAEICILRGAETVLASDAAILCELHPYAWEGFGTSAEDLSTLLARFGRKMRYIDQAHMADGPPSYGIVLLER